MDKNKEVTCRKSELQVYDCYVELYRRNNNKPFCVDTLKKSICVDACLVKELFWLWDKGITTTGCCCGGHVDDMMGSYIGVIEEDIPRMKELGYIVKPNSLDLTREDSFETKTFPHRKEVFKSGQE